MSDYSNTESSSSSVSDLREQEDRKLFDSIAQQYAKKDQVLSSKIARKYQLMRVVEPLIGSEAPAGCLLEIGCGSAASAGFLKDFYLHYIGIDHSAQMIEVAKSLNQGNKAVRFIHANAREKFKLDTRVDVVLAVGVLHHIIELDQVFSALKECVVPDAHFYALEPSAANPIVQGLRSIRARVDSGYSADQIYFKDSELRELLHRNGLSSIEIIPQGFFTPPFAQVVIDPQLVSVPLAKLAVCLDQIIDKYCCKLFSPLSWNYCIRARFPK